MIGLLDHLKRRIARDGPLTIQHYMEECLGNPDFGYYTTRDPFGRGGDFTTAPEVSQMFGELIGLWCAVQWQALGRPDPVMMVELGPGRGTLMADALRAAAGVPGFVDAVDLRLVELSPVLKDIQARSLAAYGPRWHGHIEDVPEGFAFFIANEFFDALPIRQFERVDMGWCERLVDFSDDRGLHGVLSEPMMANPLIPPALSGLKPGHVVEVCPAGAAIAAAIGSRVAEDGGAALFIDYGHERTAPGDTLQAVKDHDYAPVFETPGEADLTAHVDFAALKGAAEAAGAAAHGPIGQGRFLQALGIEARAETLLAAATPDQIPEIRAAHFRLVGEEGMGSLFKCLAVTDPALPPPPGF